MKRTFIEWLQHITSPQREYYIVLNDTHHLLCAKSEYDRNYEVFVRQKRKERSPVFIVLCPESKCKVLVQSNGGIRGVKPTSTWSFKK